MKRKAAKLFLRWHRRRGVEPELCKGSYSDGDGITRYRVYTAQEVGNRIGKIAAMHGTHVCGMCKFEKKYDKPRIRHEIQAALTPATTPTTGTAPTTGTTPTAGRTGLMTSSTT